MIYDYSIESKKELITSIIDIHTIYRNDTKYNTESNNSKNTQKVNSR